MMSVLERVRAELVEFLRDGDRWKSLLIDYHPPIVERLWLQWNEYRVCLHKIHPCTIEEALMHPHPWPSAMLLVKGRYEMPIGFSRTERQPTILNKLMLVAGSSYEMIDSDVWHSVAPMGGAGMDRHGYGQTLGPNVTKQ